MCLCRPFDRQDRGAQRRPDPSINSSASSFARRAIAVMIPDSNESPRAPSLKRSSRISAVSSIASSSGVAWARAVPIAVEGLRLGCLCPARPVEAGEHHPALADGTEERLGRRAELVPGHRPDTVGLAFRVVPLAGFEVGRLDDGEGGGQCFDPVVPLGLGVGVGLGLGRRAQLAARTRSRPPRIRSSPNANSSSSSHAPRPPSWLAAAASSARDG